TVLVNVARESPAYREEVFGPVASIFRVRDADDAIAMANDSPFGLAASAWTNNPEERSEEHTSELQSPCNLVCRLLLEKKNAGGLDLRSYAAGGSRGGGDDRPPFVADVVVLHARERLRRWGERGGLVGAGCDGVSVGRE